MSTIAIVGGHGKIAQQLIPLLAERGDTPVALVRKPEQAADLEALGAQVRILDIENAGAEEFAEALKGSDAVVFSAGGGGDGNVERKRTVDLEGSLKSIVGAAANGIHRFVQVSAMGVEKEVPADAEDSWKAYVAAKRDADAALRKSDLDWTIVRPGRLLDDPPTGKVQVAESLERGDVTRADVAAVIAAALQDDATIGRQFDLLNGDVPISDALSA